MILRKLTPRKAIGAQPFFVDTFNAIVDFVRNLKGDKDVNSSTGSVEVDRTNPAHPVIRSTGCGGEGQTLTIVGNDVVPTVVVCKTGRVTFASAADSNVVVTPSADLDGNVTLTVGVYYA